MNWETGTPIEIFADRAGNLILHKYSQLDGICGFGDLCIQQLHKQLKVQVMLCDLEQVIAVAGLPNSQLGKTPPKWMQDSMHKLVRFHDGQNMSVPLLTDDATLIGSIGIIAKDGSSVYGEPEVALAITAKIIAEYVTAS